MPTLTEILDDPERNGVYRLTDDLATSATLIDRPDVLRLDARRCPDKDDLLEALGEALSFPDYYGINWDALEECLFDLSWWAGPVIVLIEHANVLDRGVLETLVDIWTEVSAAWAEVERICLLLLSGADAVDTLPAIDA